MDTFLEHCFFGLQLLILLRTISSCVTFLCPLGNFRNKDFILTFLTHPNGALVIRFLKAPNWGEPGLRLSAVSATGLWWIWRACNEALYDNSKMTVSNLFHLVIGSALAYDIAKTPDGSIHATVPRKVYWSPPQAGLVKLNYDDSMGGDQVRSDDLSNMGCTRSLSVI